MSVQPPRVLATSAGTRRGNFGRMEWLLVGATSLTWGSSYLWIALGLETFAPGLIAWLRVAFGAAVLLGVVILSETLSGLELLGLGVVSVGAYLGSRKIGY